MNRQIVMGPVLITLSIDKDRAHLTVQDTEHTKALHYTQEIMPGESPYNIRWAMEMVLRRAVGNAFDKWIVMNPAPPKQKELDISIDEDIIE